MSSFSSNNNMGQCESTADGVKRSDHYGSSNFARSTSSVDKPLDEDEHDALSLIQKNVRNTKAIDRASAENQWKLFAMADTMEENDTLLLSSFLDRLVRLVPGTQEHVSEKKSMPQPYSAMLDEIIIETERDVSAIEETQEGQRVYKFKGDVTPKIAHDVCNLFRGRHPGKVEAPSLLRIQRNIYKKLKVSPNSNEIDVDTDGTVTVVGDIHGQITDLLLILDEIGEPSPTNKILFNGDFVDRGQYGVEVIILMFTYYCAYPGCVFLNRGNHEDPYVCANYGFRDEVFMKYDNQCFDLFSEIFRFVPLFSLINNQVFVVHGGLFSDPSVKLADLNDIDRKNYQCVPPIKYPDNCRGGDSTLKRQELLNQLQRDALWSDPKIERGLAPNPRGAGVQFGPDIASTFMKNNNVKMIIRSHECCKHGIAFPYAHNSERLMDNYYEQEDPSVGGGSVRMSHATRDDADGRSSTDTGLLDPWYLMSIPLDRNTPLLCTLFSASNYSGGENEAAYMTLKAIKEEDPVPPYANEISSTMHFVVHRYKTSSSSHTADDRGVLQSTTNTAHDLLLKKRRKLFASFKEKDSRNTGNVSNIEWSEIMTEVTGLEIRWLALLASIVPADAIPSENTINYMAFIDSLAAKHESKGLKEDESGAAAHVIDAIYGNKKRVLAALFEFFDTDSDGEITPIEFKTGCESLNASAGVEDQLTDLDYILNIMDFDHSGTVDVNEFFEAFRNCGLLI